MSARRVEIIRRSCPYPSISSDGSIISGLTVDIPSLCLSQCDHAECKSSEPPIAEGTVVWDTCREGFSVATLTVDGDPIRIMGVVEQTTSSATPRFKKVWKTQKCKKPDVDRWCRRLGDVSESINQLVAEASQDELGTLHEVKNVISSIFRIVEESLDKKYIGITFGDKLDIADPEWKKLYHATRQLENVLQLTDIVVNPAAASFGQPVRTAIYRTADSVVRTLEPKAQRLGHRLFIRGNSYRESQLYRSFPLIFFILVDNAIKYSNKGEDVIVEVNDTGGKVHVCVSSVGVPISDDEIDRIFDKNFRGTNTKGAAGSGVGLYVAQRIAAANGFKIWYESSPYPSESDAGLNEFMFTVP